MNIIILSGGSIKGAFQAGVLKGIAQNTKYKLYRPDDTIILGTSVGSLNGLFILHEIALSRARLSNTTWNTITSSLINFYLDIKKPSDIVKKRNALKIAWDILSGTWGGLYTLEPLIDKMKTFILDIYHYLPFNIPAPALYVSYVDLDSSQLSFKKVWGLDALKYVVASASIPIVFPAVDNYLVDGGLRSVIPDFLSEILKTIPNNMGTSLSIFIISTHPDSDTPMKPMMSRTAVSILERTTDIMVQEIIRGDIEQLKEAIICKNNSITLTCCNRSFNLNGIYLFRPEHYIDVSIDNFDNKDIKEMIQYGIEIANKPVLLFSP